MAWMPVGLNYDLQQLLRAKNEYNKAALLPATLDEYKQVFYPTPPEKPTKQLSRGSRNTWIDLRTG